METRKDLPLATALPADVHRHAENNDVIWVHLCTGEIVGVTPATDIEIEDDRLVVRDGETVVATFFRDQVFYTCRDGDACPILD